MSALASGPAAEPRPKEPPPDLVARAPRPAVVRLRKAVVQATGLLAAALLAGALAWAFVIQPHVRAATRPKADDAGDAPGSVRPADVVAQQPGSYDRLAPAALPAPRLAFAAPAASHAPSTAAARSGVATPSLARDAARSGLFFAQGAGVGAAAAAETHDETGRGARSDYAAVYSGHALLAPLSPYELKAGAVVPAVLLTAVDTTRAGPVVASVTQNVFDSVSGRYLLVPEGARLIGRHNGDSAYGEHRAFITWERLVLPNGKSLVLGDDQAVDAQGAVGVRGDVDRRLGPLAVATLFGGAITALGTVARDDNPRGSGGILGDVGDAAAIQGSQTASQLIGRELQVHPSIRLPAGAPVRVLITRDQILEPFQP